MAPFDILPKSAFEVIAPDGKVRGKSEGIFSDGKVIVFDAKLMVFAGDEIRRRLPNGADDTLTVADPVFYDGLQAIPPHFQIKVTRKGVFPHREGGYFSVVFTGSNARLNIHSTDNSHNVVGDNAVFNDLSEAIRARVAPEQQPELLNLVEEMRSTQGTDGFRAVYNRFVESAAAHMTIIAPFLPALAASL